MFVVGQGASDTDRKNVFTVKNDGQGIFASTVTAAAPTKETHLTTKKYVDTAITNLADIFVKTGNLPIVTTANNGQVLQVVDGIWQSSTKVQELETKIREAETKIQELEARLNGLSPFEEAIF